MEVAASELPWFISGPGLKRIAASVIGATLHPCYLGQRFLISGGVGEFVGPGMDDGMAIDVVDSGHDALLEFILM
ncbi:hypothetical protein [Bradyrhizobium sp. 30]|uniref:hypothetical protein n=1 Tax=Bradyrhizobium sp. 30 TaxID=2782669 RepID=UPI001FF7F8F8|nr:hypothetical protein [Bradyrhizobium sp. 30]MCK1290331.1 hypothetical protein [Bradyrhizobium sp. 30]